MSRKLKISLFNNQDNKKFYKDHHIFYPENYSMISKARIKEICNGAGGDGGLLTKLIPNTLYGLDCKRCFDVHDVMYAAGGTPKERKFADDVLLKNMHMLIDTSTYMLRMPRKARAFMYYSAVRLFGAKFF